MGHIKVISRLDKDHIKVLQGYGRVTEGLYWGYDPNNGESNGRDISNVEIGSGVWCWRCRVEA